MSANTDTLGGCSPGPHQVVPLSLAAPAILGIMRLNFLSVQASLQRAVNLAALGSLPWSATFLMLLICMPVIALAQDGGDACVKARISPHASIDFPTAYAAIAVRATAWQRDARLVKAGQTFGNVDAEGRSKRWHINYFSAATQQGVTFDIDKGVISCQEGASPGVRYIPDLAPNFQKDVKRVLAVAAAHGGSELLAKGYVPTVQLRTYPAQHKLDWRSSRAVWGVDYLRRTITKDGDSQTEDGDSIYVVIDANTGEFIYAATANAWWKFWRRG